MEKIDILLKLSTKFCKKYIREYINLLFKPVLIGIFGCLFIPLAAVHPALAILALIISIPCTCYAFWRGFLITYALNIAALNYIKKVSDTSLENCYKAALKTEKDFALYIGFFALICVIRYLLTVICFFTIVPISRLPYILNDIQGLLSSFAMIFFISIINTIFLIPILNYATQAYLFKQNGENYFQLLINCYKKLDSTGILVAILITVITFLISSFAPVIYLISFTIINAIVYSINTFWYYSRISK